jgi:hypothetical protein
MQQHRRTDRGGDDSYGDLHPGECPDHDIGRSDQCSPGGSGDESRGRRRARKPAPAAFASFTKRALWQRLPAVVAGRVVVVDRLGYPGTPGRIELVKLFAERLRRS